MRVPIAVNILRQDIAEIRSVVDTVPMPSEKRDRLLLVCGHIDGIAMVLDFLSRQEKNDVAS